MVSTMILVLGYLGIFLPAYGVLLWGLSRLAE